MFVDLTVIYIADSESSSIRALDLRTGGSRSLVGGDPMFSDNLFRVICLKLSNQFPTRYIYCFLMHILCKQ